MERSANILKLIFEALELAECMTRPTTRESRKAWRSGQWKKSYIRPKTSYRWDAREPEKANKEGQVVFERKDARKMRAKWNKYVRSIVTTTGKTSVKHATAHCSTTTSQEGDKKKISHTGCSLPILCVHMRCIRNVIRYTKRKRIFAELQKKAH